MGAIGNFLRANVLTIMLAICAGILIVLNLQALQGRAEARRAASQLATQLATATGSLEVVQADLASASAEATRLQADLASAQAQLASASAALVKHGLDKDVEMPSFSRVAVSGLVDKAGNEDRELGAVAGQAADERLSFLHKRDGGAPVLNIKFSNRLSSAERLVGRWWFAPDRGAELKGILEFPWPETFQGAGGDIIEAFQRSYRSQMMAPGGAPGALAALPPASGSATTSVTTHKRR